MSRIISLPTTCIVTTSYGVEVPLTATWSYDTSDPWAVNLTMDDDGVSVTWAFARDLLDVGMISSDAMGAGDVKVWTCGDAEPVLHILLCHPVQQSALTLDWEDAEEFLCTTYTAVPCGLEREHADIDGELNEMFGETA